MKVSESLEICSNKETGEKFYNFFQQVFTFFWVANITVANITVSYCEKDTTTKMKNSTQ